MHCKNCLSPNIRILQTTSNYSFLKCRDCLFYYKNLNECNYLSLDGESYSNYNFSRKKEVADLDLVIKTHCKKNKINILEIGSGTGTISNELVLFGYKVTSVEPNRAAAEISKKLFPELRIINDYFNASLIQNDIDIILLYDVIEHLEPSNPMFDEIYKYMNPETLLLLKSGNPRSFNAQLFITRWVYILSDQHISFFSYKALKAFCKNKNFELIKYYKFKHAYGGIAMLKILKNLLKLVFKTIRFDTLLGRNFSIDVANDHFIAVIKKKQ